MIGLDAGTLLRLFDRSDPALTHRVEALVAIAPPEDGCFVHPLALVEVASQLERVFRLKREAVAEYLERILRAPEFTIPNAKEALAAVAEFRSGKAAFADCMLAALNRTAGCEVTVTLDICTAESAGFSLLKG
ncbi:MAG TPA: PIN domain-containing protein [Xanthobacteraceae bacterium]|nr:PIN domain-containing protein [Xanthobacteraceae bacterium]